MHSIDFKNFLFAFCTLVAWSTGGELHGQEAKKLDLRALDKLVQEGSVMAARPGIEALVSERPGDAEVALLAARLYRKMGLSALAIIQYERVRQFHPRMVEPLVALSRLHLENLSSNLAIQLAEEAVSIAPQDREAGLALVQALCAGQRLKRAAYVAGVLEKRFDTDPEVMHALYMVASASGDDKNALSYLERASEREGQRPSWRLELAALYRQCGRFADAESAYKSVLASDASNIEALSGLARLYEFSLGDYARALATYRKIIEIFPDDTAAHAGVERVLAKRADMALWIKRSIYRFFGLYPADN